MNDKTPSMQTRASLLAYNWHPLPCTRGDAGHILVAFAQTVPAGRDSLLPQQSVQSPQDLEPESMQNNGSKPSQRAQKAMTTVYTLGFQVLSHSLSLSLSLSLSSINHVLYTM